MILSNCAALLKISMTGADQRKHQSSSSLAFVRGIRRWPVNSPHKGPVTRKMFPFDDVIMPIQYLRRCLIFLWIQKHWGLNKMGCRFTGDIFRFILLKNHVWFIWISIKLISVGSMGNTRALAHVMAWRGIEELKTYFTVEFMSSAPFTNKFNFNPSMDKWSHVQ